MFIEISPQDQKILAGAAAAAGFDATEHFLSEHIHALAVQAQPEGILSEAELEQSLAMCDQGLRDIENGDVITIEQALDETLIHIRSNV